MAKDSADKRTSVQVYRDYYDGDVDAHYTGLDTRFFDSTLAAAAKVKKTEVPIENVARIVITKHCGLVPIEAAFAVIGANGKEDKKLTDDLNAWTTGDNHGPGIGLNDWTPEILLRLCVDGEFPIKMIMRGVPIGRYVDDYGFSILTDPANILQISGYSASYDVTSEGENDDTSTKTIAEHFGPVENTVTQDGEPLESMTWEHDLGWTPLTLIKRADVIGDKHGRSLMADLIEAQDNINRCNTVINRANKYGAFPILAPKTEDAPESTVSISPSSYLTVPTERITADGASVAAFEERKYWIQHMYSLAGLKETSQDNVSQTPNTSGKALIVLNAEGKRMVAALLSRLRRGYVQYCQMALALMKSGQPEDFDVAVTFPSLDQEDAAAMNARAQMLFNESFSKEGLRTLGYDDASVDLLMAERDDSPDYMPGATIGGDDEDSEEGGNDSEDGGSEEEEPGQD